MKKRTKNRTNGLPLLRAGVLGLLGLTLVLIGCESGTTAVPEPPEGWEATETRWWRSDVDTSVAFRDLESLETMFADYEVPPEGEDAAAMTDERLAHDIRTELVPMYRHNPEVVDSLFNAYVRDRLDAGDVQADDPAQAGELRQDGYDQIREHFREPVTETELGEDVQLTYPDSLRGRAEGTVSTQVYLDEEGVPQAVELLESVHPTLDAIGMRAATEMRWRPAYILEGQDWEPIPSWVRFGVTFRMN